MIKQKASASQFKAYLIDLFKVSEDGVTALTELLAFVFNNLKAAVEDPTADLKLYYKFCQEVVGQW
jgi:hypothetical protein